MGARVEAIRTAEAGILGELCVICDGPISSGRCLCGTRTSTGIVRQNPMSAAELNARLPELVDRFPGDKLAKIVRTATAAPDPCTDGHLGPWAVISRHGSAAPHSQCSACGAIDRTGTEARKAAE